MDPRTRRSPARFLAPLALIAVVVAFFAVISSGGGGGSSSSTSEQTTSSQTSTTTSKKSSPAKKTKTSTSAASGPSTYTVQVGDTLGGIAGKTGVPLSKLQELNPNVDPHAMVSGQKIKLR